MESLSRMKDDELGQLLDERCTEWLERHATHHKQGYHRPRVDSFLISI